jgi:hypothetical protein
MVSSAQISTAIQITKYAVVAAEKFELAEQIEQRDAPGDGAERKIVSGQPDSDEAEQHGSDAADQ